MFDQESKSKDVVLADGRGHLKPVLRDCLCRVQLYFLKHILPIIRENVDPIQYQVFRICH